MADHLVNNQSVDIHTANIWDAGTEGDVYLGICSKKSSIDC